MPKHMYPSNSSIDPFFSNIILQGLLVVSISLGDMYRLTHGYGEYTRGGYTYCTRAQPEGCMYNHQGDSP